MSTKPASKAAPKPAKPKVTLKQLIARTQKIADDANVLLGQLRSLDNAQGAVVLGLSSGGTVKQNA